jgi:long-subunit acyl-CoA synthetase (AMP-forming)
MAVGVYQTSTPEQVAYILRHSEALVAVLDTPSQWRKVKPHLETLPKLRRLVLLDGLATLSEEDRAIQSPAGGALLTDWAGLLKSAEGHKDAAVERMAGLLPDQIATIIYTSSTTGDPKGVMLTHLNLSWTASAALTVHHADERDAIVSYLPLSHIAEQMFSVYLPLTSGSRVYFAGGLDKLRETLVAARPTVFLGVPRVWEKLQAALQQKLSEASPIQRRVIAWARDVGTRAGRYRLESGKPFGLLALEEAVAQRLLFNKVKTAIGLDKVRVAVSGAAAIRKDVLDFFLSLGLPIYEVYGQSECAGPATSNASRPGETRLGTVGRAIPGTVVKLAEDGEILFQGPNLCAGYFKDPASTSAAIQDGWLHTGDVGELDDKGFLRITDRKKDLFKTSGGKYIAPQPLEGLLRSIPIVAQAVIIGENRKYVTALLTLTRCRPSPRSASCPRTSPPIPRSSPGTRRSSASCRSTSIA